MWKLLSPTRRVSVAVLSCVLLAGKAGAAAAQPVTHDSPDVLVVGGTPAGVAAAVSAARRGEDVVLACATGRLGGVLTGAMMDQWDLNVAPGGQTIQRGLFAELYARLGDAFTPSAAAEAFTELVAAQPRIDVRYDIVPERVSTVALDGGRSVSAVTFRERDGEASTIAAPFVVDATDDGDVAALAGARYDVGRQDTGIDERMQAVTEMFTFENVDWAALADAYDPSRDGPGGVLGKRAWGYTGLLRDYRPSAPDVVVADLNLGLMPDGSVSVNAIDVVGIDGRVAAERDRAQTIAEREAPHLLAFLRDRLPGLEAARVGTFAPELYVRETRHVAGIERLTTGDVWFGRVPSDTIGLASYPIDVHPVDVTDRQAFAPLRHVYGVPFGALVPEGLRNVVLASPAISASHLAAGSARVIPTTIEEGEAAGAACALALRDGIDVAELAMQPAKIAALRASLAAADVVLDRPAAGLVQRTAVRTAVS